MKQTYAIHEADGQDVTMRSEVAYSLVTGGGKPGQGYPVCLQKMMEPIQLQSNQNQAMISRDGIAYTLTASMGMGGGYVPMIVEEIDDRFNLLGWDGDGWNPDGK